MKPFVCKCDGLTVKYSRIGKRCQACNGLFITIEWKYLEAEGAWEGEGTGLSIIVWDGDDVAQTFTEFALIGDDGDRLFVGTHEECEAAAERIISGHKV